VASAEAVWIAVDPAKVRPDGADGADGADVTS